MSMELNEMIALMAATIYATHLDDLIFDFKDKREQPSIELKLIAMKLAINEAKLLWENVLDAREEHES